MLRSLHRSASSRLLSPRCSFSRSRSRSSLLPLVGVRSFSSGPTTSTVYTAQVHTVGGRGDGRVSSSDGNLTLRLVKPKEMGGKEGEVGTNPEQLFAAGYSACFQGAMGVSSGQLLKRDLPSDTSIDAKVSFLRTTESSGGFKLNLAVEFDIHVPGFTKEETQKVVDRAHSICPYSNATRGNISVKLNVV